MQPTQSNKSYKNTNKSDIYSYLFRSDDFLKKSESMFKTEEKIKMDLQEKLKKKIQSDNLKEKLKLNLNIKKSLKNNLSIRECDRDFYNKKEDIIKDLYNKTKLVFYWKNSNIKQLFYCRIDL
jgi:hypothetical protein